MRKKNQQKRVMKKTVLNPTSPEKTYKQTYIFKSRVLVI